MRLRPKTRRVLGVGIAALALILDATAAFTEAPELNRLVEAGKLPPLDQRLPVAPLIISPVEKPGTYGGTWRMVLVGYDNGSLLTRSMSYENLVRWDPNWTRVLPNVASSWLINADATVYRFQLRRGMRWSDGEPFTARDIVAWVDDVARNGELSSPPPWLIAAGGLPECTALDDFTVEFHFASPNALFLEQLAGIRARELTHYPAHYFRKFHPRYNAEGAEDLMRRTGLPWPAAFNTIYTPATWRVAGIPTLDAWVLTTAYAPGTPAVLATRNPYYWKVDTLGRQLPYLNTVQFDVVHDKREARLRALAGEVDYQHGNVASVESLPEIKAAEQAGTIRTVQGIPTAANSCSLSLNLTHRDPAMRAVLADKRVRIALSEAINRPALIQEIYRGEGRPWQIALRPESPLFNRRLGEQYTSYSTDRANAALDAAGLSKRGADGMRTLPNGQPFHLQILVPAPGKPEWPLILDHILRDWRAVGVAMDWISLTPEMIYPRILQNQHDAAVWDSGSGCAPALEPEFFVPISFENAARVPYAVPWALWFLDPRADGAEPPPASVQAQQNIFRRIMTEPNSENRAKLMTQIITMAADEFYAIGIHLEPGIVSIRTPGFRNVPASHFISWLYPDPGPFNPCQFFQENGAIPPPVQR